MEWRPIETAPKDGTWVLLYAPPKQYERETGEMYVATWEPIDYNSGPQWAFGARGMEHSFLRGVYDATHWMPLPQPPR